MSIADTTGFRKYVGFYNYNEQQEHIIRALRNEVARLQDDAQRAYAEIERLQALVKEQALQILAYSGQEMACPSGSGEGASGEQIQLFPILT